MRATEAFTNMLKAMKTQLPKEKFAIQRTWHDSTVYLRRINSRCARWVRDRAKATVSGTAKRPKGADRVSLGLRLGRS